jgi:hypothetical protein
MRLNTDDRGSFTNAQSAARLQLAHPQLTRPLIPTEVGINLSTHKDERLADADEKEQLRDEPGTSGSLLQRSNRPSNLMRLN